MAGEATIDSLLIKVSSNAQQAQAGIEAAASALGKLKQNIPGDAAVKRINTLATNMGNLTREMRGASNAGVVMRSIASAMRSFDGSKGPNAATAKNIKAIADATRGISTGQAQAIGQLGRSLSSFKDVKISKTTSTNLKSLIDVVREYRNLDLNSFTRQVDKLTLSLTRLGGAMSKVGAGYKSMPRSFRSGGAANRTVQSANYAWTSNLAGLRKDGRSSGNFAGGGIGGKSSTTSNGLFGGLGGERSQMFAGVSSEGIGGIAAAVNPATAAIMALVSAGQYCVNKFSDYNEDMNLFAVAMGKYAGNATDFANKVQDMLGIDSGQWMRNQGVFMTLANGMGVASDKAAVMSKQLTQLGYDLSSFYNIPIDDAMLKIQSGLSGELEPLRRLGYDLSEAKMQQTAYSLGIKDSVQNMTQATKVQLRYYMIMKQVSQAHGDMARTINQPANAMRVLWAQVDVLARSIGQILIPMLNAVLPYLTAIVKLATQAAQAIASFFGFNLQLADLSNVDYSGMGDQADQADQAAKNTKKATKATKEYKNQLLGFDKINNLTSNKKAGTKGDKKDKGLSNPDIPMPKYDFLKDFAGNQVEKALERIKKLLQDILKLIAAWKAGLRAIRALMNAIRKLFDRLKNRKVKVKVEEPKFKKLKDQEVKVKYKVEDLKLKEDFKDRTVKIKLDVHEGKPTLKEIREASRDVTKRIKVVTEGKVPELEELKDKTVNVKYRVISELPKIEDRDVNVKFNASVPEKLAEIVDGTRKLAEKPVTIHYRFDIPKVNVDLEDKTVRIGFKVGKVPNIGKEVPSERTVHIRFAKIKWPNVKEHLTNPFRAAAKQAQKVADAIRNIKLPNIGEKFAKPFRTVRGLVDKIKTGLATLKAPFLDKIGKFMESEAGQKLAKVVTRVLKVLNVLSDIVNVLDIIKGVQQMIEGKQAGSTLVMQGGLDKILDGLSLLVAFTGPVGTMVAIFLQVIKMMNQIPWEQWQGGLDNIKKTFEGLPHDFDLAGQKLQQFLDGTGISGAAKNAGDFVGGLVSPQKAYADTGDGASTEDQSDGAKAAEGFKKNLGSLPEWVRQNVIVPIQTGLSGIWTGVSGFFANPVGTIQGALASLDTTIESLPGIGPFYTTMKTGLSGFWTGLTGFFANPMGTFSSIFSGIGDWFSTNVVQPIGNAFGGIGGTIASALSGVGQTIAGAFSGIGDAIGGVFGGIWSTISGGAQTAWNGITQAFSPAISWFSDLTKSFGGFFSDVFYGIGAIGSSCWQIIQKAWETAGNWFSQNVLQPIWRFFNKTWHDIKTAVLNVKTGIENAWKVVSGWFNDNVLKPLGSFFDSAWKGISKAAGDAKTTAENVWNGVSSWFDENIATPVRNAFDTAWKAVSGAAGTAWKTVKGAWDKATNWFNTNIITPLKSGFKTMWTAVKNFAKNAWNGIKSVFGKITNFGSKIAKAIANGVKGAFNGVFRGINRIISGFVGGINTIIGGLRGFTAFNIQPFSGLRDLSVPQIPMLKKEGGFVPQGQMFIAREAGPEMVGTMGGQTAVANNQQIVRGIASGVASANAAQNSLLMEQNRLLKAILEKSDAGGTVITGTDIAKAMTRSNRVVGRPVYQA